MGLLLAILIGYCSQVVSLASRCAGSKGNKKGDNKKEGKKGEVRPKKEPLHFCCFLDSIPSLRSFSVSSEVAAWIPNSLEVSEVYVLEERSLLLL